MPDGFCEPDDVRKALQDRELGQATGTEFVEPAIYKISDWLARKGNRHWYDTTGDAGDVVPTTAASVENVPLDVPSSPHAQRDQFYQDSDARYPVTSAGPYAKIPLPYGYVQSLTKLEVRDRDGGVEDWVAASDKAEGRGEDYYIQRKGQDSFGRTYLYIRARSIGPRYDFEDLLTLSFDYGLDASDEEWQDVRRGVAQAAAAELVIDDNVLTAIPDSGTLVGVDTQRQQLLDDGRKALEPYLTAPGQ